MRILRPWLHDTSRKYLRLLRISHTPYDVHTHPHTHFDAYKRVGKIQDDIIVFLLFISISIYVSSIKFTGNLFMLMLFFVALFCCCCMSCMVRCKMALIYTIWCYSSFNFGKASARNVPLCIWARVHQLCVSYMYYMHIHIDRVCSRSTISICTYIYTCAMERIKLPQFHSFIRSHAIHTHLV